MIKLTNIIPDGLLKEAPPTKDAPEKEPKDTEPADTSAEEEPPAEEEPAPEDQPKEKSDGGDDKLMKYLKNYVINLNVSKINKYNKSRFKGDQALVTKITKDGIEALSIPEKVKIFVNFEDIK